LGGGLGGLIVRFDSKSHEEIPHSIAAERVSSWPRVRQILDFIINFRAGDSPALPRLPQRPRPPPDCTIDGTMSDSKRKAAVGWRQCKKAIAK
jgi:hypothetical protein